MGKSMFKKISFRTKILIFIIAAVIGIVIIVSAAIKNRQDINNYKFDQNAVQNTVSEQEKIAQAEADKQKQEEEQKKHEEEAKKAQAQKELEDKYQQGYEAYSAEKYDEAIKIEDEVIKSDDQFYKAYTIKGIALCYSKQYTEGMKNIDKALEIKPDYGHALFNKALALELYGKYNEALEWYDKDLAVENFVWSYYGKAAIYGRKGDVANTVKYLKMAINLQENVKEEARKEKDFDNVRNSKEFKEAVK